MQPLLTIGSLVALRTLGPAAAPSAGAPPPGPADTAEVGVVTKRQADPNVFPDPRKFARGFFAEASLGPSIPLGPTAGVLGPGVSTSARLGWEFRRWVALQAHATASLGFYDDGTLVREHFQQYFYTGEVRFGIPIRRFLLAFQGGAGLQQLSNNLLQIASIAPDPRLFAFAWDGSLALDFHSLSRHFSGGLVATYLGTPRLENSGLLLLQLYLRFTL
jgi:hypothetical protein